MNAPSRSSAALAAFERAAMLAIPSAAALVAAAVLLGPGASRPAAFARAYGAPSSRRVSLRVLTSNAAFGVDEALPIEDLALVQRTASGDLVRARATSHDDGVAEMAFDRDETSPWPPRLAIVSRSGVLAEGTLENVAPQTIEERAPPWLEGPTRGELHVRVLAVTGLFAAPFPGALEAIVTDDTGPVAGAAITFDGPGADFDPQKATANDEGHAKVRVTPRAHVIDLAVDAAAGTRTGHFEGHLPVVPGAMALESGHPPWVLVPSPRPRAYLSLWSDGARVDGQIVSLEPRADETHAYAGAAKDEGPVPLAKAYVTLSTDPLETSVGTLTIPPHPAFVTVPKLGLLLDGRETAIGSEDQRAWHARRAGILVILASAIAEALVLAARGKRSQAQLEAHLARESEDKAQALLAARTPATYWALASIAIVLFSFAVVAGLAALR